MILVVLILESILWIVTSLVWIAHGVAHLGAGLGAVGRGNSISLSSTLGTVKLWKKVWCQTSLKECMIFDDIMWHLVRVNEVQVCVHSLKTALFCSPFTTNVKLLNNIIHWSCSSTTLSMYEMNPTRKDAQVLEIQLCRIVQPSEQLNIYCQLGKLKCQIVNYFN